MLVGDMMEQNIKLGVMEAPSSEMVVTGMVKVNGIELVLLGEILE